MFSWWSSPPSVHDLLATPPSSGWFTWLEFTRLSPHSFTPISVIPSHRIGYLVRKLHRFSSRAPTMTLELESLLEILILFPPATSQAPSLLEKSTRPLPHLSRVRPDSSFFSSLIRLASKSCGSASVPTQRCHPLVSSLGGILDGCRFIKHTPWFTTFGATIVDHLNTQTFMPNRIGSFVGVESANTWSAVF